MKLKLVMENLLIWKLECFFWYVVFFLLFNGYINMMKKIFKKLEVIEGIYN